MEKILVLFIYSNEFYAKFISSNNLHFLDHFILKYIPIQ